MGVKHGRKIETWIQQRNVDVEIRSSFIQGIEMRTESHNL